MLTPDEFVNKIDSISRELSLLTEEEEMNILINLVKEAVERRNTYPLFIVEAIIDVLDVRKVIFRLAPSGKRMDN